MKLRNKMVLSAAALALAAGGWAWTGAAAARSSNAPADEDTLTYHRPDIVRPPADQDPAAQAVSFGNWVSPSDLTFHPIVPCRVVDTRNTTKIGNAATYSFDTFGSNFAGQGGLAGDCGIPFTALAVEMNVTSTGSIGDGYFKLYPFAAPQPNASILNYLAGQNIANSTTAGRCFNPSGSLCTHDFTVYVQTSSHLLVDVLGYYEPPNSAQVNSDGSLTGSSLSVVDVLKFAGSGAYYVAFDRDVRACVFSVSDGTPLAVSPVPYFVEVHPDANPSGVVFIHTWATNGVATDYPFQLVAVC